MHIVKEFKKKINQQKIILPTPTSAVHQWKLILKKISNLVPDRGLKMNPD